ncbi:hypothetical protein [Arthrobacter flavus]|uniref:Uncharacterized protein n=1 Tax=Arthrobacter flavus TaxID=95172 RepID=A0ABW4QCB7_9MICC
MSNNKRNDSSTVDLHPWPIPVNSRVLHIAKLVLGAGMIVILLTQVMPVNLLGGMLNNLFTVILLLSWAGPARRMMRRYSAGGRNKPSAEEQ